MQSAPRAFAGTAFGNAVTWTVGAIALASTSAVGENPLRHETVVPVS